MTAPDAAAPADHLPSDATAGAADGGSGVAARHDASHVVLGMLAFGELGAFSRMAADAALAPSLTQRLELSRLAGQALARVERVAHRLEELGVPLEPVMAPFGGVLTEFEARTPTSTWWERLLKGYVGYGVADDFSRLVAQPLDEPTRDLVVEVLAADGYANLVIGSLRDAAAADPTLASRLALWGRRLVGESLGVVQRTLAANPVLLGLLEQAVPEGSGDPQQRLFSALTAEHSRRMERLGLTP